MENLDIKDLSLQQQVSNDDRILMTEAANDHSASAMTVGKFKELIIAPSIVNELSGKADKSDTYTKREIDSQLNSISADIEEIAKQETDLTEYVRDVPQGNKDLPEGTPIIEKVSETKQLFTGVVKDTLGRILFTTKNGIYELTNQGLHEFALPGMNIQSVLLAKDSNIYFGGTKGIWRLRPEESVPEQIFTGNCNFVMQDIDDTIYFGCMPVKYLDSNGTLKDINDTYNRTGSMAAVGPDNVLYIVASSGIFSLNRISKELTATNLGPGSNYNPNFMKTNNKGQLYVGNHAHLHRLKSTNEFEWVGTNYSFTDMAYVDDYTYFTLNYTIAVIDPQGAISITGPTRGFQKAIQTENGDVYFTATNQGAGLCKVNRETYAVEPTNIDNGVFMPIGTVKGDNTYWYKYLYYEGHIADGLYALTRPKPESPYIRKRGQWLEISQDYYNKLEIHNQLAKKANKEDIPAFILLTQAEYDALTVKDNDTLYLITD